MSDATWVWFQRLVWASLPFTAGPVFADALAAATDAVRATATVGLWAFWGVGLVATLVPHPITLTITRIIHPAALAAVMVAAIESGATGAAVLALVVTALATIIALAPAVGAEYVNGSSYGDERRLPLRLPAPLLFGPLPAAWLVTVAAMTVGPLLLADRRWILGALFLVILTPLAWFAVRSLHTLSRRWVVFVPAGLVLHDRTALAEPVLFRRNHIDALGPAYADTEAHDLTVASIGAALELRLDRANEIAPRPRGGATPEVVEVSAVLFAPTRLTPVLAEAKKRRIRLG